MTELIHRKGKEHIVPDFLSRSVPLVANSVDHVDCPLPTETTDRWYNDLVGRVRNCPVPKISL